MKAESMRAVLRVEEFGVVEAWGKSNPFADVISMLQVLQ